MWNLKNDTNEVIYKLVSLKKKELWLPKGMEYGGEIN